MVQVRVVRAVEIGLGWEVDVVVLAGAPHNGDHLVLEGVPNFVADVIVTFIILNGKIEVVFGSNGSHAADLSHITFNTLRKQRLVGTPARAHDVDRKKLSEL